MCFTPANYNFIDTLQLRTITIQRLYDSLDTADVHLIDVMIDCNVIPDRYDALYDPTMHVVFQETNRIFLF